MRHRILPPWVSTKGIAGFEDARPAAYPCFGTYTRLGVLPRFFPLRNLQPSTCPFPRAQCHPGVDDSAHDVIRGNPAWRTILSRAMIAYSLGARTGHR